MVYVSSLLKDVKNGLNFARSFVRDRLTRLQQLAQTLLGLGLLLGRMVECSQVLLFDE